MVGLLTDPCLSSNQATHAYLSVKLIHTHPLARIRKQPLLVSGGFTHPAGAVLAAAWEGPMGQGRLMVLGSSELWGDEWLEREGLQGNAAVAEAAVAVRVFLSRLCCACVGWSVRQVVR